MMSPEASATPVARRIAMGPNVVEPLMVMVDAPVLLTRALTLNPMPATRAVTCGVGVMTRAFTTPVSTAQTHEPFWTLVGTDGSVGKNGAFASCAILAEVIWVWPLATVIA